MDTHITIKGYFTLFFVIICISINAQPKWLKVSNQECTYYDPYYEEGVTVTWSGGIFEGKANGTGTLEKYKNGVKIGKFQGPIANGQIQGKGSYTIFLENGTIRVFNGYFEEGDILGEGDQIDFLPNGQTVSYKGSIVSFYWHGKGFAKYPDGSSFDGLFNMGQPFTGKYKDGNNKVYLIYHGSSVEKIPKLPNSNYSPKIGIQQTEYFDENWSRCDLNNARYYRLITYKAPNRPQGLVKDFYISGKLQSVFECKYINYDEDLLNFSTGETKWYYENGQVSRVCSHNNNRIVGEDINYYDNGKKARVTIYDNSGVIVSMKSWHKSGKPNIVAEFQNGRLVNDRYIEYDENGLACQVMQENFVFNKETWEHEDDDAKSEVVSASILSFIGKTNTSIRINYLEVNQKQDFSIEGAVDLLDEKANTSCYGLMLGFKDWTNCLVFLVSGDGQYMIQNTFEGIKIPIREWHSSPAINKGRAQNLLKVMKLGEKMIFSINGTMVEKIDAFLLRGGYYGMVIGGKGNFALENLIYKEYLNDKFSVSETQKTSTNVQTSSTSSDGATIDASGTGFFIDKRGYLATNYHVTKGAKGIYVCLQKEGIWSSYHAIVVKNDPINDLSIIRIDDPEFEQFSHLPYNFVTDVEEIASDIFTLGYPRVNVMGADVKYSAGSINSKTGIQGDPTHYQISAHIDYGNSGGPMFNAKGAIVGITDGGLDKAQFGDVNYAIKSSFLKSLVDALPMKLNLPNDTTIEKLPKVEQIKVLSQYTALILIDLP